MALLQDTVAAPAAPAKSSWFARHHIATAFGAALFGAAVAVGGAVIVNATSDSFPAGISADVANSDMGDGHRQAQRMLENR